MVEKLFGSVCRTKVSSSYVISDWKVVWRKIRALQGDMIRVIQGPGQTGMLAFGAEVVALVSSTPRNYALILCWWLWRMSVR